MGARGPGERPSSCGPRSALGPSASRKCLEPHASEPGGPGGHLTQLWHLADEGREAPRRNVTCSRRWRRDRSPKPRSSVIFPPDIPEVSEAASEGARGLRDGTRVVAGPSSVSTRGSVLLTSVWSCSPQRKRLLEVVPRRPQGGSQCTPQGEGLRALHTKLARSHPTPTHFQVQPTHFTEAARLHVGWLLPQTDQSRELGA